MKKHYLIIVGTFILGFLNTSETHAACNETRSVVTPGDTLSATSGCYSGANGKTYSVPNKTNSSTSSSSTPAETNDKGDSSSIIGIDNKSLREGDVNMDSIFFAIVSVIRFLLAAAGTFAIFALIYQAVQMQMHSGITGDSSGVDNAKKGMIGALMGFVLAILSWFLITRFAEILTNIS